MPRSAGAIAPSVPDPSPRPSAVFLSYAREDTEAARRIVDALRAFGVEVWFDQSELVGGDTWDTKIKTQIRECALFVAVISVQTQARREGYFRREWNLAVERTLDMAHGTPFLLPVVVDETKESAALVPEQFLRVQWTRLPQGTPTPQFVEQLKRHLAPVPAMETGRPIPFGATRASRLQFSRWAVASRRRQGSRSLRWPESRHSFSLPNSNRQRRMRAQGRARPPLKNPPLPRYPSPCSRSPT